MEVFIVKKNTLFSITLILILGLGTVANASVEVIINGGFETEKLEPWINPSIEPYKWDVVSNKSHSGMFSAYTYTGSSGGIYVLSQSFTPVAVDNIISFYYWYYADTTDSIKNKALGLWFTDGSYAQDFIWGATTNEWAFRDVMPTLQIHSGKYLKKIGPFDSLNTSLYFDDVSLIAVPEPSIVWLTCFGLIVTIFAGFRKKVGDH